jgi:hypothetical protein
MLHKSPPQIVDSHIHSHTLCLLIYTKRPKTQSPITFQHILGIHLGITNNILLAGYELDT